MTPGAVPFAAMLGVGVVLAISLPLKENQPITLDIACVSGAPVVGVWVDAENGGSEFAAPTDDSGGYAFELAFGGAYEAHVGCGGSREHWWKVTYSDVEARPHRVLLCDDTVDISPGDPGPCRDLR